MSDLNGDKKVIKKSVKTPKLIEFSSKINLKFEREIFVLGVYSPELNDRTLLPCAKLITSKYYLV